MTTWQRAEKLISVAHPDVREKLIKDAESIRIWREIQQTLISYGKRAVGTFMAL